MKRKFFATAALLCLVVVAMAAVVADLSGKWVGALKTPDGNEFPLNYTFKVDGSKLTGLASSPQGDVEIAGGTVKGDSLSFTIPVNGSDIKHTGRFYSAADSVGLDIAFGEMKFHTTLKRADK